MTARHFLLLRLEGSSLRTYYLTDLQVGTNVHGHAALLEDLLPHLTAQVSQPSRTGCCNDSFHTCCPS